MKQQMHDSQGKGEKTVIVLAMLVLMLVSFCLFGIIYEPDGGYVEDPPNVVTAADSGSDAEGPRVVGGFVPERHPGPPPPREAPLFMSWRDILNSCWLEMKLGFMVQILVCHFHTS